MRLFPVVSSALRPAASPPATSKNSPTCSAWNANSSAAIQTAVNGLRAQGYSWADIALRIGITRQAAHQRWASPEET